MQANRGQIQKGGILIICLLCFLNLPAQYFVTGQDPASFRWRQINTGNFQVIYPESYEKQAQRAAHVFEKVYDYSGKTLKHKPGKISVIIHSATARSNGFVAWSPSRVELYPTPYQEMYAQDWIEQLAIHELRHHVQIDKIETELPFILKILLGEQAAALVVGVYLPFWFLEGDAVVTETALSNSGRGRLPSFSMELKAQVDEKEIFSLDKAYLGSYKDYIPDHYQLGYQLVSNIRNQYGGEVWGNVLHFIARHPFGLTSFSRGLKISTGKNQDEHYRSVMNNLRNNALFGFSPASDSTVKLQSLTKFEKYYTSYLYPHFLDDSTCIALRTSIDKTPAIVRIDRFGKEEKLFEPGIILEQSMSYADGKIAWIEISPDTRWANKERSLLRILDIQNDTLLEKVFDTKYQAPAISPDGRQLAVVRFNNQNLCSIVLLNLENGTIKREIAATGNNVYFTPSWSTDMNYLYVVELSQKGKSIVKIDAGTGTGETLTDPSEFEIIKPIQKDQYLYYTSNFGGKNEGYAYDLANRKTYRVLTSKYGIRDLRSSEKGTLLVYSDYSSNGFKIAIKEENRAAWMEVPSAAPGYRDTLAQHLSNQENEKIDFSSLDTVNYLTTNYSKTKNLFNIHSWSPVYIDSDQMAVNAGFSVVSQNKLTTAITQLGYEYSTVNKTGKWVGKFEYSGWYPVLSLYGDYGNERDSYYQVSSGNPPGNKDTLAISYVQKVMNLRLSASVPFNFSRGKMYRMVEPGIQIGYSHYWQEESTPSDVFRGSYVPLSFKVYAHNLKQQSHRDLQPSWGQLMEVNYKVTPFGDRHLGKIASAEGIVYLPGIFRHQGIRIYGGYQSKISDNQYFSDIINYPRGYANQANKKMFTWRSDYSIPLFSPDWHLWRLYYLKRVAVKFHYDFANLSALVKSSEGTGTVEKRISSVGAELMTECHFLRFIAPVKLGVRESWLIESQTVVSEFIFSLNLRGM